MNIQTTVSMPKHMSARSASKPAAVKEQQDKQPPEDSSDIDWGKVGKGAAHGAGTTAVLGGISVGLAKLGVSAARDMGLPGYLVGVAAGGVVGAALVLMGREEDVLPPGA